MGRLYHGAAYLPVAIFLHHDMAAAPVHFFKARLFQNSVNILAGQGAQLVFFGIIITSSSASPPAPALV
jgi:hypothetical protein